MPAPLPPDVVTADVVAADVLAADVLAADVVTADVVTAADGVRISVRHDPPAEAAADPRLAVVLGHGFIGTWRRPEVRADLTRRITRRILLSAPPPPALPAPPAVITTTGVATAPADASARMPT